MKLSEIAIKLDCEMRADNDVEISGVAGIEDAGPGQMTFVSNRKYISHIKGTKASAIILGLDMPDVGIPSLRTANPYLAFARVLELFHTPILPAPGLHPAAVIAKDAQIGPDASTPLHPARRLAQSGPLHGRIEGLLYRLSGRSWGGDMAGTPVFEI